MSAKLAVAAMLIFGLSAVRAEEPDSTGDAPTEESTPAPDTISAEPAPAPSARPARTPFNGQRKAAPRPQAQSSGGSNPGPSGSPAPAPEPEASPEPDPAPSNFHPMTPPPASPPPSGSRTPAGKIGSAWTPEGTGIPTLDAEYKKQQAAIKAGINACQQKTQAAAQNAKPRESTPGQGTPARVTAVYAAMKAAGITYTPRSSGVADMLNCGGTPSSITQAWSNACRLEIGSRGRLDDGCYSLTVGSHGTLSDAFPNNFCSGIDFASYEDCYRYPFGHTAITCSFDPAETLRRSSFGTDARGAVPAPFTAAWSDPNGQAVFNRPALDMHKELRDRLAYFDGLKADLQEEGYDPQLVYVKVMTGELKGKCQNPDPSKPMDPSCGHFNGGGMTSDSAMLETFKGKTLAQVASKPFSGCGDAVFVPGR